MEVLMSEVWEIFVEDEESNNNNDTVLVHWFNNHENTYIKQNITIFKLG